VLVFSSGSAEIFPLAALSIDSLDMWIILTFCMLYLSPVNALFRVAAGVPARG
jgi:hypothetical protein